MYSQLKSYYVYTQTCTQISFNLGGHEYSSHRTRQYHLRDPDLYSRSQVHKEAKDDALMFSHFFSVVLDEI